MCPCGCDGTDGAPPMAEAVPAATTAPPAMWQVDDFQHIATRGEETIQRNPREDNRLEYTGGTDVVLAADIALWQWTTVPGDVYYAYVQLGQTTTKLTLTGVLQAVGQASVRAPGSKAPLYADGETEIPAFALRF